MVWDEPTTWTFDDQEWSPRNYENDYDGHITLRRALALSRNIATIKVAEQTGFEHVASLWKRHQASARAPREPIPSIALGVFELTPIEVAEVYTRVPEHAASCSTLTGIARIISGDDTIVPDAHEPRDVARPETTLPRHEHDAERHQRGHRRRRPRQRLHARRRRQVRHDQRPAGRLVRRLHAGAARRWSGWASTTTSRSA